MPHLWETAPAAVNNSAHINHHQCVLLLEEQMMTKQGGKGLTKPLPAVSYILNSFLSIKALLLALPILPASRSFMWVIMSDNLLLYNERVCQLSTLQTHLLDHTCMDSYNKTSVMVLACFTYWEC